jgi:tape measure domain-containing protein
MVEYRIVIVADTSRVDRSLKKVNNNLGNMERMMHRISRLMHAAFAVTGIMIFVKKLVNLLDVYTNMANRLRVLSTANKGLEDRMDSLFRIANNTRSAYETTAEVYTRTALAVRDLGVSQKELANFTQSVNQAVIISGTAFSEAHRGIIQFSQGLASGRLRGDELRSVMEQLPVIADVIAKELGVTRGAVRDLGAEGKLTSAVILRAFRNAREELNERFGRTIPTINQAFQVFRNNIIRTFGEMNNATGLSEALAKAIMTLAKHVDVLVRTLVVAGAALGTFYILIKRIAIGGALASFVALLAAHPFALFVTGAVAATTALVVFGDKIKVAEHSAEELTKEVDKMYKELKKGAKPRELKQLREEYEDIKDTVKDLAKEGADLSDVLHQMGEDASTAKGFFKEMFSSIMSVMKLLLQTDDVFKFVVKGAAKMLDGTNRALRMFFTAVAAGLVEGGNMIVEYYNRLENWVTNTHRRWKNMRYDALKKAGLDPDKWGVKRHALEQRTPGWDAEAAAKRMADAMEAAATNTREVSDYIDELFRRAERVALNDKLAKLQERLEEAKSRHNRTKKESAAATDKESDALEKYLASLTREVYLLGFVGDALRREEALLSAREAALKDGIDLNGEYFQTVENMVKGLVSEAIALEKAADARDKYLEASESISELIAGVVLENQLLDENAAKRQAVMALQQYQNVLSEKELEILEELLTRLYEDTEAKGKYLEFVKSMTPAIEEYNDQLAMLNRALREGKIATDQYAQKLKSLREEYGLDTTAMDGMQRAVDGLSDGFRTAGDIVETSMTTAFDAATDAVVRFAQTGKFEIKDMMRSIAADMLRLSVKSAFGNIFGAIVNAGGGPIPKFATGGSFMVGGTGGTDSQLVAFRATPGERVDVSTPRQQQQVQAPPTTVKVVNVLDEREALTAFDSPAGQRLIRNTIERNQHRIRRMVGR